MATLIELQALVQRRPADAAAHLALGQALEQAQRFGDAAAAYLKVLDLDPASAEACFRLGTIRMIEGDPDTALPLLITAVNRDRTNGNYWSNLGTLLLLLDLKTEALAAFEAARALAPERAAPLLQIARLHFERGDYDAVLALDDALAALGKTAPESWILRANTLLALMRVDEAGTLLTEAIACFPENADILATAAGVLMIGSGFSRAGALYERALARDPRHYDSLVGLGSLRGMTDDPAAATACYLKALEIDPERIQAYAGLAALAFQNGDAMGLSRWVQAGLEKAPNHPDLLYYLGWMQARDGLVAAAIASLEKVIGLNPRHYQAHLELGRLYEAPADQTKRRGHLNTVIDLAPQSAAARAARQLLR